MDDQNLVELVQRSKNGDSQAMEKLVACCQPGAFRLALSILDDPAEADEVTQESLIRAIHAISSFRGEASFQTWFYRIIVNNCLGKLRKRRARRHLSRLLAERFRHTGQEYTAIEMQVIQDESMVQTMLAVNALDLEHRLPVVLRYYHELPIAQIAEILKVSARTVHTRLRQAHAMMRKALGDYDGNN